MIAAAGRGLLDEERSRATGTAFVARGAGVAVITFECRRWRRGRAMRVTREMTRSQSATNWEMAKGVAHLRGERHFCEAYTAHVAVIVVLPLDLQSAPRLPSIVAPFSRRSSRL